MSATHSPAKPSLTFRGRWYRSQVTIVLLVLAPSTCLKLVFHCFHGCQSALDHARAMVTALDARKSKGDRVSNILPWFKDFLDGQATQHPSEYLHLPAPLNW